jgi:pilus assembly protein CpaE
LGILKDTYDFVVVDTPPAFDDVVLQAFDDSDLLLLIGTLDVPALKSLKITAETLTLLNHPRENWRFVLNRADMKVGLTPAEVEQTLDMKISAAIPQSNDVPASINQGRPIVLESPRHAVSQSIKKLARECVSSSAAAEVDVNGKVADVPAQSKRGGGLLRRRAAK